MALVKARGVKPTLGIEAHFGRREQWVVESPGHFGNEKAHPFYKNFADVLAHWKKNKLGMSC